jgi:multimeric flavodoxin WrbA
MKHKILIVYHSMSGNTAAAAREVARGAKKVKGVRAVVKRAASAKARDLASADGYCFGTPDYFSQMAGMLKDFFDRTLYPSKGRAAGKPCGLFVTHGGGGRASRNLEAISGSFKVKRIGKTVLVREKPGRGAKKSLRALGLKVAKAVLRGK